jgi:hypothetical protein
MSDEGYRHSGHWVCGICKRTVADPDTFKHGCMKRRDDAMKGPRGLSEKALDEARITADVRQLERRRLALEMLKRENTFGFSKAFTNALADPGSDYAQEDCDRGARIVVRIALAIADELIACTTQRPGTRR